MNKILICLLFGAILLIQQIDAKPSNDISHEEESSESYERYEYMGTADLAKLTKRGKLFAFTIGRLKYLMTLSSVRAPVAVQAVLNDTAALKTPSAALQVYLKDFRQFVAQTEYVANKPVEEGLAVFYRKAYGLVAQFAKILSTYNTTLSLKDPTMEDLLVRLSMQKNDFALLNKEFTELFAKFTPWFLKSVDKYLNSLNVEERKTEANLIAWLGEFKNEPTALVFDKFLDLFDINVVFKDVDGWF